MDIQVLTNPESFFRRKSDNPGLIKPAVIVALAGVGSVISSLLIMQKMSTAMPEGAEGFMAIGGSIGAIAGFVAVFVMWIIYAGVFHVISIYFDGEGEFRDTVMLVGWGFIPSIFSGVVGAIATYYALQGVTFPQNPQAMQGFAQQMKSSPTLRISGIFSTSRSSVLIPHRDRR